MNERFSMIIKFMSGIRIYFDVSNAPSYKRSQRLIFSSGIS